MATLERGPATLKCYETQDQHVHRKAMCPNTYMDLDTQSWHQRPPFSSADGILCLPARAGADVLWSSP